MKFSFTKNHLLVFIEVVPMQEHFYVDLAYNSKNDWLFEYGDFVFLSPSESLGAYIYEKIFIVDPSNFFTAAQNDLTASLYQFINSPITASSLEEIRTLIEALLSQDSRFSLKEIIVKLEE